MPSTAKPLEINVSLVGDKIQANPAEAIVPVGETRTLTWKPADDLAIKFVGFDQPVGANKAIAAPGPQNPGGPGIPWVAVDHNPARETYSYTLFVERRGVVYSSDPRIVNEGQGGD